MMYHRYQTASADETVAVARRLGGALPDRIIVLLTGPLGSGKTTFVRGLVSARSSDHVSSPTFVYHQRYTLPQKSTVSSGWQQHRDPSSVIDHVDCYRIHTDSTLRARSGIDELLADVSGWLLIEWPLPDLVYPADVPRLTIACGEAPGQFTLETTQPILSVRLNAALSGVTR